MSLGFFKKRGFPKFGVPCWGSGNPKIRIIVFRGRLFMGTIKNHYAFGPIVEAMESSSAMFSDEAPLYCTLVAGA